jgi:hypothetical protein
MIKLFAIILLLFTEFALAEAYPYRHWPPYPSPYGYQYPYYPRNNERPEPDAKKDNKKPGNKTKSKSPEVTNKIIRPAVRKPKTDVISPGNSTTTPGEAGKTVQPKKLPRVEKSARQSEPALEAMKNGDYAIAYYIWRPLAEKGDAKAQYSLGWMYHNGYGLSVDNQKAKQWWEKSARQGFIHASFALGLLLSQGDRHIEENIPDAVKHYLDAALKGHQDARKMLIHLLFDKRKSMLPLIATWDENQKALLGKKIRVKVPRANTRKGPGTDNSIIAVLREGDELIRLDKQDNWIQAYLPGEGKLVWVYFTLVEDVKKPSS